MTAPFPHRYEVTLAWKAGRHASLIAPPRPIILGGAPPEFDGTAEVWSPEHLLLSSASLCLMTTFQAIAARSKLEVASYDSQAEGILDKTPEGLLFTRVRLKVAVGSPDSEKAARLLELAKKHCIVANSLKVPVELEVAAAAI